MLVLTMVSFVVTTIANVINVMHSHHIENVLL
jgi:hypothetical protein